MSTTPTLTSNTSNPIYGLASRDILLTYSADENSHIDLPVDPVVILKNLEINVAVAKLKFNTSFVITADSTTNEITVALNRSDSTKLKRLASAQAIAEISTLKSLEGDFTLTYYWPTSEREILSEETLTLAQEIIMPGFAVRKFWSKNYSTKKLAKLFDVPKAAMLSRLDELQLI